MKSPRAGKSRLRRDTDYGACDDKHGDLVLAIAKDTIVAARSAPEVGRLLIVTADPAALSGLRELDAEVVDEDGAGELNTALRHGERLLRTGAGSSVIGILQADLPALRPDELSAAITEAGGRRSFTSDRHGSGTTLLLSARAGELAPRFGPGSARAHTDSGALPLTLAAPSLRCDVDTAADLEHARAIGIGPRTAAVLGHVCAVS